MVDFPSLEQRHAPFSYVSLKDLDVQTFDPDFYKGRRSKAFLPNEKQDGVYVRYF
jgi:hypothetical protein